MIASKVTISPGTLERSKIDLEHKYKLEEKAVLKYIKGIDGIQPIHVARDLKPLLMRSVGSTYAVLDRLLLKGKIFKIKTSKYAVFKYLAADSPKLSDKEFIDNIVPLDKKEMVDKIIKSGRSINTLESIIGDDTKKSPTITCKVDAEPITQVYDHLFMAIKQLQDSGLEFNLVISNKKDNHE